ncbi:MAG: hypothetical protein IJ079_01280 [Lachnospiraceae bacterium]|nr:hypothetical protein [Lachnospiraceae bacterium]
MWTIIPIIYVVMNLIEDNYLAANHSFLYALHEKDCFDKEAFMELCEYISTLKEKDDTITLQLCSIQNELLKHIIYHFDPKDMSRIQNLPDDYTDYILKLEQAINQYLKLSCRNG